MLERQLGLAIIAATPPRASSPRSVAEIERRIRKIKRETEFLKKCPGDALTMARTSLKSFLETSNSRDWIDAWRHLATTHSDLVGFTDSALWRDLVPSKESQGVTRQIVSLERSMTRLTNQKSER